LSFLQGLTEFLPVSSSGHLVVLQKIFGFSHPPVLFDVLLHVGTLGAIIFYFRKELVSIPPRIIYLITIGTIPAAIIGVFLEKRIDLIFNSPKVVGLTFLITAGLLFSTRLINKENQIRQFNQLKWKDALFIGIFQAIAILPGISRSGATIVFGLWRGLKRETAFVFSSYLAIPAISGAFILESKDLFFYSRIELIQGLLGMIIAGIVGFFALKILEKTLKSAKFFWFGIYCLVLGVVILLV